jgi:NAD-dependent dihydropyrimidine dehydrogenase PreA subunit
MTYVINEPCSATKDASCIEVCSVDGIHPTPGETDFEAAEQLSPEWRGYIERNAAHYPKPHGTVPSGER